MAASLIRDETSVPRIVDGGVADGAGGIFLLGAFAEVAAGEDSAAGEWALGL